MVCTDCRTGTSVTAASTSGWIFGSRSRAARRLSAGSCWLPRTSSAQALAAFGEVKAVLDPGDVLNPGVIVAPRPVDADLRPARPHAYRAGLAFRYADDAGAFGRAVSRCTGVGKCRADLTGAGGVMCPSFLATRDEKDSTRARARVLQEMVSGGFPAGW